MHLSQILAHNFGLAVAGHMLSDVFTIGLALIAVKLAQRSAVGQVTREVQRVEIWAALINGLVLIAIALLIAWEAVEHLQAPEPVLGLPILWRD